MKRKFDLKKFILSEMRKLQREAKLSGKPAPIEKVKAEETTDYANSIEKDIDFVKALNIQERKLRQRLRKLSERKRRLKRKIIKNI